MKKIEDKETLTREEDLFYLIEVVGLTPEKAENVLAINEEGSATVIVD